jgi:hypothetical protein
LITGKEVFIMTNASKAVLIVATIAFVIGFASSAVASPPSKVALEYNATSKTLTVVAIHPTKNVETHFIYIVEVRKNKEVLEKRELKKQVDKGFQIAVFEIKDLAPGDVLWAKASCNRFGSKSATLKNTAEDLKKASEAMSELKKKTEGLGKTLDATLRGMKTKDQDLPKEAVDKTKEAAKAAVDKAKEAATGTVEKGKETGESLLDKAK